MTKSSRGARALLAPLAVLLACWGCGPGADTGGPGPQAGPGPMPGGDPSSPVGKIMTRLNGRGTGLHSQVGDELKKEPPPWDAVRPQTQEYAQLAAELGKNDPPRGDKDSWAKLTAAYADSAAALDKAAEDKDAAAAKTAYDKLSGSCMACHRAHRGGPGGPGGRLTPPPPPPP
jgi:hypothetical protein